MNLWLAALLCVATPEETVEPPVSIVRQYLQPIGMPVVALYHDIRESPFLNMHYTEASGLEALGDLCLAPSRYLFGGKNVSIHHGICTLSPSYTYEGITWLKTTLSILALPIGDLLGCALKGAALLSQETARHYQLIDHFLADLHIQPHTTEYQIKGISTFYTDEKAPCLHQARPSVLSHTHQLEIEAIKEVCAALEKHGIIYWLDCGTCLGVYRYGGMIPWDDDIDIAILMDDHENVKKTLKTLDPARFQVQDWSSYYYPSTFLKLYLKETHTLVDFYHYTIDERNQTLAYFYTYKDSPFPEQWKVSEFAMIKPVSYDTLFPLKRASLDGIPVWVPHDIKSFLHSKYGQNLEPTMIWDNDSQSYKKVKHHPYWKQISL